MTRAPLSPISALIAHLESKLADRRVLVVGDAERSVAEHLLERGARLVQVLDPDAKRVAHAAAHNTERRVTYAQLTESSFRDGSYECVLIEDVRLADDLAALVKGTQRSLGPRGIAVFCMRNDEGTTGLLGVQPGDIEYDALCDVVEEHFEASRMLGQSPFLGYSVVEFGLEQAPEPTLDNAYLGGEAEAPDFYVAIAGAEDVVGELDLEDMTIVQLPAARFVADNESQERDLGRRAARRAEALESELSSLRKRADSSELERFARELEQRDAWIRELESRAESADARADDAQAQVDELEQELEDIHGVLDATRKDADRAVEEREAAFQEAQAAAAAIQEAKDSEAEALARWKEAERQLDEARRTPAAAPTPSRDETLADPLLLEELEDLREELEDVQLLLKKRDKTLAQKEKDLSKLGKELDSVRRELQETLDLAKEAAHHSAGREALENEVTLLDERNRALQTQLNDKSRSLERLERRLVEQEKELDDLHEEIDETEAVLTQTRKKLEETSGPTLDELERDVRGLEEQLKERGHRIIELESQQRNLEAYAKTLKVELDHRAPADNAAELEFDELSRALAEKEADLVAARWRIGQLEQQHRPE